MEPVAVTLYGKSLSPATNCVVVKLVDPIMFWGRNGVPDPPLPPSSFFHLVIPISPFATLFSSLAIPVK